MEYVVITIWFIILGRWDSDVGSRVTEGEQRTENLELMRANFEPAVTNEDQEREERETLAEAAVPEEEEAVTSAPSVADDQNVHHGRHSSYRNFIPILPPTYTPQSHANRAVGSTKRLLVFKQKRLDGELKPPQLDSGSGDFNPKRNIRKTLESSSSGIGTTVPNTPPRPQPKSTALISVDSASGSNHLERMSNGSARTQVRGNRRFCIERRRRDVVLSLGIARSRAKVYYQPVSPVQFQAPVPAEPVEFDGVPGELDDFQPPPSATFAPQEEYVLAPANYVPQGQPYQEIDGIPGGGLNSHHT
ncbi:hypothetical protein FS837_001168 [Tulasnella sp. UAMH 9824]|nr:hypothetical protein FS837_001168 [Tulasnella sp. UAMH 9824]